MFGLDLFTFLKEVRFLDHHIKRCRCVETEESVPSILWDHLLEECLVVRNKAMDKIRVRLRKFKHRQFLSSGKRRVT